MFDDINNYPLTWPTFWKRTKPERRRYSQFADRSVAKAVQFVVDELRLLGAQNAIISTNVPVKLNGAPRSGQRTPDDPGVAVYFTLQNQPRVLACDTWVLVEENMWAIGKHIEAVRGQQRWGVGTVDQAFAGYEALPAPKSNWWEVLGVDCGADLDAVQSAYRQLAKKHHPDVGGDSDQFRKIQAAWDQAQKDRRP